MAPEAKELPAQYDPTEVEGRLYDFWLQEKVFEADSDRPGKRYVVVMPPPNVTGVLHMGHALTTTLEDMLTRWRRMQGFNTLWLPGTDHAGIATQMVVERNLMKEQKLSKHDLGREKFLEKVWEWKDISQGTILGQMKLIGCGVDWKRLKFTLDDDVSLAVRTTFYRLHKEGLLYRDTAIIQWCPRCRTALSDLEVKPKEVKSKIWHIKYPVEGQPGVFLTVATTRPETMLGDTAVAVHPEDERYTSLHGKRVILPIQNRPIPIIADPYVDKEFGTGALKITPGHDPNDYLIGKKHKLPLISLLDDKAHLNELAGPEFQGLAREKARELVLEKLTAAGLLEKEEPHGHNVGHCDRCGTVAEPRVSDQWFVNAEELAKEAIRVVENKEIRILPEEWEKTYFEWMRNIRPWCVSRQLWWGHRIPAWHCADCKQITVAIETPSQCEHCRSAQITQDSDVLDTWFSSGLWPFSTLGWPKETKDMQAFYPTDVMETGFDILFFWVARMIMLGIKMTGKIPFHTVYLHPMVRDEQGQKMSKTKGNVKDPLEFISKMGADPLRFTLAAMAVHGRDVLLSDARIEGYRNFVNKIWNAARFTLMHFNHIQKSNVDANDEVNQWIWSRFNETAKEVNAALEHFRFFDAANLLYHFIWSEYCDWYLELIKPQIEERKKKNDSTAVEVLEQALRLLHPIMPFVTEELWHRLPVRAADGKTARALAVAAYPAYDPKRSYPQAEARLGRVIRVVEAIRSKRGESNLAPANEIAVQITAEKAVLDQLTGFEGLITRLVRAKQVTFAAPGNRVAGQVLIPIDDATILIPLKDLITDIPGEVTRVEKELLGVRGELDRAREKLANPTFAGKAPPDVIEGVRARQGVLETKVTSLTQYLKELKE